MKVADKVRLEDSGAYKEIISMLRGNKQIIGYLRRKNESLQKIKGIKPYTKIDGISINKKIKFNPNRKRKMSINYSNKPLIVKGSTAIMKMKGSPTIREVVHRTN